MQYLGSALTDMGIRKGVNQDSLCVKIAETEKIGQVALAVVCDGMGGLEKGELASATLIRKISDWFENRLPEQLNSYSWEKLAQEWEGMIRLQNCKMLEYGRKFQINMGTTLTALLIIENRYMIVHVGDTRVYKIADKIEQITEDQTVAVREMKLGNMTPEEVGRDARKNMLLQCVGASKIVKPDILFGTVQPQTTYMLCTDGFRHVLKEGEIYAYFQPGKLIDRKAMDRNSRYLIEQVKSRNEKDNISVILVKAIE